MLRAFFKNKLYKIYHLASTVHSALKIIDVAEKESEKFQKNLSEHLYAGNKEAENTARNELENIQKRADTALNKLTQRYKTAEDDPNTLESKVVQAIREDNQRKRRAAGSGQAGRDRISSRTTRRSAKTEEPTARRVDEKLSTLSQRERDLFHQAYKAIFDCVDEETALMIYEHIEAILQ
jgi:oligoendopeptidase F